MAQKKKGEIGSSFDGFLAEEGILETCEERALKQILADQIKAAMERDSLTKSAMAERIETSRRARSPAGPQEYWRDAAHHATRRRRSWKRTPFGTVMNERHR